MSLIHGYSRKSISKNIRKMRREGYKLRVAIAAALTTAREAARKAGRRPRWLGLKHRGSR